MSQGIGDTDELTVWQNLRGLGGRFRRRLRRRLLEPVLLGTRSFRETVLNAVSARGHLVYCELPGGKFFVDPSDRVVGSNLMWRGEWQREEFLQAVRALEEAGLAPKGKAFIDVGANIGTHTVYALTSGAFARVVAFEPEPRNLRLLCMNAAINELSGRVTAIGKALGKAAGEAILHLHPRNQAAHAIGRRPSYDGTISVPVAMARLDDELRPLIGPQDIGLVWIDVEGLEPEVIEGLGDYLGQVPLAIEYAPYRYSEQRRRALDELLIANYRTVRRLGETLTPVESIDALRAIDGIVDIVVC
ncbi:hypothetical protein X566_24215 [Afipia sp. P52-10]|jgi:FkbM family methyltransferase|uniref:FkbM family methyltransferase n=1 Tax=Afipia sp. P52-10 TaxID=1429916 RepID=UPI0003DF387F|nr:FkbM family methyltransferase [Afipia sp. P52-10]ETR75992.1 hypothetical protein X566_24215 [Afipia sp. P52-10]